MSGVIDESKTVGWETPAGSTAASASGGGGPAELLEEHPEALAGAAFVGGLLAAWMVRRLGR